jgi:hypothetical protein
MTPEERKELLKNLKHAGAILYIDSNYDPELLELMMLLEEEKSNPQEKQN